MEISARLVPDPLVIRIASRMCPGNALDLACGTGRHAAWLAEHGWSVTAVDIAPATIAGVDVRVADLEKGEYTIERDAWDLVLITRYLQRDLFAPAKLGVKPRGVLIAIVLLEDPAKPGGRFRARPGELRGFFDGWEILHSFEGASQGHRVAEIAARRAELSAFESGG